MANLQQSEQQLDAIEKQLTPYEGGKAPIKLQQGVKKQWNPLMKAATGTLAKTRGDFMERFMGSFGAGGTTAADLSPSQQGSQIGRNLGTMVGQLDQQTRMVDYYGGQATDMARLAQQAFDSGQNALAQKYQRASQRYQMAWQAAENDKQRAAAAAARRGSGGGGFDIASALAKLQGGKEVSPIDQLRQMVMDGQMSEDEARKRAMGYQV